MSKAFVKEGEGGEDDQELEAEPAGIPAGGKNYITPAGAQRLQDEFKRLMHTDRPEIVRVIAWAAGNGDRSENADYIYGKRRLREIDRRLRFLQRRLDGVVIVDPAQQKGDRVLFGATVTVGDESGKQRVYRIVGIDETDLDKGHISWISPIGKALLQARVGDVVMLRAPRGDEELEILELRYEAF